MISGKREDLTYRHVLEGAKEGVVGGGEGRHRGSGSGSSSGSGGEAG